MMKKILAGVLLALILVVIGCQIEETTPSPRGSLRIETIDSLGNALSGAIIYIDDVPQAETTPALIGPMAAGTHRIVLRLRGFVIAVDTVEVTAGTTNPVRVALVRAATGWIQVNSNPGGATIYLNEGIVKNSLGAPITTPALISASVGNQSISVVLASYKTVTPSLHSVDVGSDTTTIGFDLQSATAGKLVGNVLPNYAFRLAGPDSMRYDTLRLDQFRGHLTVISCWFTTCVPCRNELPFFNQLYTEFASRGVRFVALTTPQPRSQPYIQIRQAIQEVGLTFPVTIDPQPGFWYQITPSIANGYPLNVVLDSTGTIIASRGSMTEAELRNLITSNL